MLLILQVNEWLIFFSFRYQQLRNSSGPNAPVQGSFTDQYDMRWQQPPQSFNKQASTVGSRKPWNDGDEFDNKEREEDGKDGRRISGSDDGYRGPYRQYSDGGSSHKSDHKYNDDRDYR